jgi:hypothetical protein
MPSFQLTVAVCARIADFYVYEHLQNLYSDVLNTKSF